MLTFVLVLLLVSQTWLLLTLLRSWGSVYTPAGHVKYTDALGKESSYSVNQCVTHLCTVFTLSS